MNNIVKLCVLTLLISAHTSCRANDKDTRQMPADTTIVEAKEQHLSLLIAGDLMQHGPQIKAAFERGQSQARLDSAERKQARPQVRAALQSDGTYNYDECFARVKNEIERADVAIGNFEVTLGGKPYTGYPQFRAPDEFLQACIDAGFDVLLTANNHCVDSHRKGLERTIAMMDSLGVPHLGTYINPEVRNETYPFLLEKNGLRVVLLNFTYSTNGLPVEAPNVVNMIDTTEIRRDIEKAKTMQPDVIIALPHWGIEYQQLPSPQQRELADWLIRNGVDHVIGGHPHVAQPLELSLDSLHLIAWSMGNVISNQSKPNTYGGYMVRMEFTKKSLPPTPSQGGGAAAPEVKTRLSDCGYMLYWVSRPADNNNQHNYRILPIDEPDSVLTGVEQKNRYAIRASMRRLMERHTKGVREYTFE